jgi:hypothetical protein
MNTSRLYLSNMILEEAEIKSNIFDPDNKDYLYKLMIFNEIDLQLRCIKYIYILDQQSPIIENI